MIIAFFLISCSAPKQTAGGSDMPNGIISGVVVSSAGEPAANASMTLKSVRLHPDGDTTLTEVMIQTDKNGAFNFTEIRSGNYILMATLPNGETSILSKIQKTESPLQNVSVVTGKPVSIHGRVIAKNGDARNVSVTGSAISSTVDANGFYVLNSVPTGDIDLVIGGENQMSVVEISIAPTTGKESLFLRDCELSSNSAETYQFHQSEGVASKSFPIVYNESDEPDWYKGTDFTGISSENIVDLRDSWNIPVIVELTSATIENLGGIANMSAIKTKVETQFRTINANFNNNLLKGKLTFSVDSIGVYSSEATSEPLFPYSFRIIYDVNRELTSAEWNKTSRTAVLHTPELSSTDLFSKASTVEATRLFAISRGAFSIVDAKFAKAKVVFDTGARDSIELSFEQPELLMWGEGGVELDLQTIGIINRNMNTRIPSFTNDTNATPVSLSMKISIDGLPASNVRVTSYALLRSNGTLGTTPKYNSITDDQGMYEFPENPYRVYNTTFANLMVVISTTTKTYYQWLPSYQVQGEWLTRDNSLLEINL